MTRKVAVIGARGFVGSAICAAAQAWKGLEITAINRGDNIGSLVRDAELIIHTANPARRFFAQNNPEADFNESVEKTFSIKQAARGKKIILISSISARTQLNTVYGRNRRACELIVSDDRNLIIRLGPMYGPGKCVGALHDILNNKPVFVSEETQYAYVPVDYNGRKILEHLDSAGLIELGARNGIALGELKDRLHSTSTFAGDDDTQIPHNPGPDAPDAFEVVTFARQLQVATKNH